MAKHHSMMKHKGHHHKGHKAHGGAQGAQVVSGNKNVLEEAEEDKTGDEDKVGDHKKHGGRAKKKKHHERNTGGKVLGLMTGGGVRPRLDRPGRKSGGGVGANRSPLSTAHNTTSQDAGSSSPTDTYGGMPK